MTSPLTATLTMFSIQVGFPVAGILVADKIFKHQKTRKFRYGFAITSFAFGGWYLSNYFTQKYLENVEITLDAETEIVHPKDLTRLIVAIDTSGSTMMDYKGRSNGTASKSNLERMGRAYTTEKHRYSIAKKYLTMAENMVKILQPDDVVFLDWNGQGVTYYDETKQSYNGTGSYKSIAEFLKNEGLDKGDFLTTTITITDAPMASFREFRN